MRLARRIRDALPASFGEALVAAAGRTAPAGGAAGVARWRRVQRHLILDEVEPLVQSELAGWLTEARSFSPLALTGEALLSSAERSTPGPAERAAELAWLRAPGAVASPGDSNPA